MDAPDLHPRRRAVRFWIAASAAGLILRLLLILIIPRWGYLFDHDDLVRWGIQATDDGVLTLYDRTPPQWNVRCWHDGRWVITQRPLARVFHYPPLTAYLLYGSGLAFRVLSDDQLINTFTSRLLFPFWGIVGEFFLAGGCAALVALHRRGRAARWTYVLVLLAPPFWLDSCYWGQFDAAPLAAGVWAVWALVRRRWMLAGALVGIAAALKPQALLILPVWILAVAAYRPRFKPGLSLVCAAAVLLMTALPFVLHSGWTWWRISYLNTLLAKFPATTLNAFNLWYVDLLRCDSTDLSATWLGFTKEAWGRALVLIGLAGGFTWMVRRWRGDARALVVWAVWVPLTFVMLATRVHERYLLLVLPFLIVSAMWWRRFWPGCAALLVVALCQMTWPLWITEPAGTWPNHVEAETRRHAQAQAALAPEEQTAFPDLDERLAARRSAYLEGRSKTRAVEWCVTGIALLGAAATVGAALSLRPDSPA